LERRARLEPRTILMMVVVVMVIVNIGPRFIMRVLLDVPMMIIIIVFR
jgi:hypothetical protein